MDTDSTHDLSLCWIRRDLRLSDHRALYEATQKSHKVAIVFVFDTNILTKLKKDDKRITFIHDSLFLLNASLRDFESELIVLHGDPQVEIPKLAKKLKAQAVYCNKDYEPYAIARDQNVREKLQSQNCQFYTFKDQVIFEQQEVLTQSSKPYTVFTPYKNAWLKHYSAIDSCEYTPNKKKFIRSTDLKAKPTPLPSIEELGFVRSQLWLEAGEFAAKKQLTHFFKSNVANYKEQRNYPANKKGTSTLSTHLRFGSISIREVIRKLSKIKSNPGTQTWLSELIWRDFYFMILSNFPHVTVQSFKPEYNHLQWPGLAQHFKAWCQGQTGFPIVDAAMRQLNTTGWMHNRLRMIVASFLTKDLLIDWKKGESYFAEKLLDFDLSANNGGWQWSASTGCDAQPYFRIFNPYTQSKNYDPDGEFIKEWIPELKNVPAKLIHAPHEMSSEEQSRYQCNIGRDYPHPIVDHAAQRIRALSLFKGK